MPRHKLTTEESAHRKARIVEMRRARAYWSTIAEEFDITAQRAHAIWKAALEEFPSRAVEEYRAEESELIDLAVRRLLGIAVTSDPSVSPRTKVEAWATLRGWSEHRCRVMGAFAPAQVEVSHHADSDFDRAYAELTEAMRQRESAGSSGDADSG